MNSNSKTGTARRPRGPFRAVSDFFNSIWLGIFLIASILVYGTLGSAVPGFRQWFELSEFRYFNHWVFLGLIVLFCINLTVATLRRIKLNVINLGVWTVHVGLLLLCFGSIDYFGNKIEGDVWLGTPSIRVYSIDRLQSDPDNALIESIPAIEGEVWDQNIPMLGGRHRVEVLEVRHDGLETGSYVKVKTQVGSNPEVVVELQGRGREPQSNVGRLGDKFALVLNASPETTYFYDDTTPALIVSMGSDRTNAAHFELPALPYYHEHLVTYEKSDPRGADVLPVADSDGNEVAAGRMTPIPLVERWRMPFTVFDQASTIGRDTGVTVSIDGYLPYAELSSTALPGGDREFPLARIKYDHGDHPHEAWLIAEMPDRAAAEFEDGTAVEFRWLGDDTELEPAWTRPIEGQHVLEVFVKDKNVRRMYDVEAGQVIPVEGTDYTLKIDELRPSWPLMTAGFKDARTPIALVVVKSPAMEFQRSVMQRFPQLNQDRFTQDHPDADKRGKKVSAEKDIVDDNIEITYFDASHEHLLIAAGRNFAPTLVRTQTGGKRSVAKLATGAEIKLAGDGVFTFTDFLASPRFEEIPVVVPGRNRRSLMDVRREKSCVRLLLQSADGKWMKHVWVPFNRYNADNFMDQVRPTIVEDIPNRRPVQFIYGRAMRGLPAVMSLERLKTEFYPGQQQAREWTSYFRYRDPVSGEVKPGTAFLNNTYTIGDWTFFQSQAAGDHKSWTVLGVGNRRGVGIQLLGCVLASAGMIYAFGIKPVLVQRRKDRFAMMAAAAKGK